MTNVLLLNIGSSTFKWSVLRPEGTVVLAHSAPWHSALPHARIAQMGAALAQCPPCVAVGHRLVHGGGIFTQPIILTPEHRRTLAGLVHLAPEHMPAALDGVDVVAKLFPHVPHVASFDTAFHHTMPAHASTYAIPALWREKCGIRRFGFHGLSVAYAVQRIGALIGRVPARMIVCHLGHGCSITAVLHGVSVDTTMGFTPLDGLVMGTRSGSIDPGILIFLQEHAHMTLPVLKEGLQQQGGLLALSGFSGDLRHVMAAMEEGSQDAALAYHCFVHAIRRAIGAMSSVLDGVDAVVFTGGIGEHQSQVRTESCAALAWAGLTLDEKINRALPDDNLASGDRCISAPESRMRVWVVHAREDRMLLRDVQTLLGHATS